MDTHAARAAHYVDVPGWCRRWRILEPEGDGGALRAYIYLSRGSSHGQGDASFFEIREGSADGALGPQLGVRRRSSKHERRRCVYG